MNYIIYLFFPFFIFTSKGTNHGTVGNAARHSSQDSVIKVFSIKNSSFRASVHNKSLKNYTLMQLDTNAFQAMQDKQLEKMNFELPFQKENIEVELQSMQLFDQTFKVMTDKSNGAAVPYAPGKFYSGKIVGDPKSMVTLSVFENEINGIISSERLGNLNLGKSNIQDPTEYILYSQDETKDEISFDCRTADAPLTPTDIDAVKPQIDKQLENRAAGCVTIDFELTYEVFANQGSIANATNWITAMFTGVKALYAAEGIDISIKSVYVWTTDDGYSDDVGSALTTLGSRRANDPAFTGTLTHLVRGKTCSGGCSLAGVAWLNVLCRNSNRFGVSEPIFTYAAYPAYSWSINVLAHELGHNFGSNHTHWCGWSGGPIDNCVAQEGSCSPGPRPAAGGGTIMSYCHQISSVGIRFSNGFGPQPGATIRARYNAATCLSTTCGGGVVIPPPPTPTCSDGIKNGTETGVDCGGSCTPCSTGCPTEVNLSQGKPSSQSSTYGTFTASKANDGAIDVNNFNHSNSEAQPWWQVDLGAVNAVSRIEITGRKDCCANRIKRFKVFVSSTPVSGYSASGSVYTYDNSNGLGNGQVLNIANLTASGRYVRIWVDNTGYGNNPIHFNEIKVFNCTGGVDPCQGNQNPTISISAPATSVPRNGSFTINATAGDSGGSINNVEFYSGSTLLGSDNSSPYSFTVSPATANSYTITAKAIDNCNASTTSNALTITTTLSCSDGFQNGTETGVDCGGSCAACTQQPCTTPINLSQGKNASQSSTYSTFTASKVNDGIKSTSNFNHTNSELQPWWQVDLGSTSQVANIELTNRMDCCGNRVKRFKIFVTNSPVSSYSTSGQVYTFDNAGGLANGQILTIPNINKAGRYVRIWIDNTGYGANPLHLTEVKVMGCPSSGNETDFSAWNKPATGSTESFKVNIYPNPVRDIVNFDYSVELDADLDATVYDVSGRKLLNATVTDKRLDISRLADGSYFIHLNYKGEKIIKKILKF